MSNATNKELLRAVLVTRLGMKQTYTHIYDAPVKFVAPDEKTIDGIMANINSLEELINFVLQMDKKHLMDKNPIQMEIDKLLYA